MRKSKTIILTMICCSLLLWHPARTQGDDELEDAQKKLLQQSLSIYEIDQELNRLAAREEKLNSEISDTEQRIAKQEQDVVKARSRAAQTLRAYYTGERNSVWAILFSARSFSDALQISEYLLMIFDNDRRSLQTYADHLAQLKELHAQLTKNRQDLLETKSRFLAQRERAEALKKQRDEQLAREKEAEALRRQSEQLIENWVQTGIPMFKKYFQALAEAMGGLPKLLLAEGNRHLSFSGLNATFSITDRELNDFLRGENPILRNLTFTFLDNEMRIAGREGDVDVAISGRYVLETKNGHKIVLFHIDELSYAGYTLPDTTAKALEDEFELGFYPESFSSFLEVTGLTMEQGTLSLQLKFKL
jgi:hypothetical protein